MAMNFLPEKRVSHDFQEEINNSRAFPANLPVSQGIPRSGWLPSWRFLFWIAKGSKPSSVEVFRILSVSLHRVLLFNGTRSSYAKRI
jgi:hypothetical protein